jgi:hypothetical protein
MRRPNGSEPSWIIRLFLTTKEKDDIQRIAEDESRTLANVCTMLIRERLRDRGKKATRK